MLRLGHVTKRFDALTAVDDLSVEVHRSEVFGLLGPNGAGKTTTIRMIIRMIDPDQGSIRLDDRPITRAITDRIGYLPEERGLYRKGRVTDLLVYFAGLKGLADREALRRIDPWLDRFDLIPYRRARCEELSKGLQQKVQLIAALLHEPDLLILDEPFSGLDPVNQILFRDIIREQQAAGRAVLLSAHQMDHVEKLCERICILHKGRAVLRGNLSELRTAYDRGHVRILCSGQAAALLAEVLDNCSRTSDGVEGTLPAGMTFSTLLRRLSEQNGVESIERVRPTLEDIFMELVRTPEPHDGT
jgi:ABC-2 type transport system ATP-binding protein